MTNVAIKISSILADQARAAATDADRSLTGQVEHWARLGRALEPLLSPRAIAVLKKSGGELAVLDDETERAQLLAVLEALHTKPPFAETARYLAEQKSPLYEVDPADSEGVIRVDPDGSRTPGRFVNRVFVPRASKA
jgi:hypothetical protein